MAELLSVYRKEPGGLYYHDMIENDLHALQEAVGGYIETVTIHGATRDIVIICDEEGRLKGKTPNCSIAGVSFCGPIVVCSTDGEEFADFPYGIELLEKITEEARCARS